MADEWSKYAVNNDNKSTSSNDEWSQYATPESNLNNGDLSSIPDLPDISIQQKPSDPLNIGDHAALSFLTKSDDQKNYLQKKYPYVIPNNDGSFMVGNSMDSLSSVNPSNSSNNFATWLASQASQIPSVIGATVGAGLGSIEPGGGNVAGAAIGAVAGEVVSKEIGHSLGSTDSIQKDAVDTAISGAFGGVGQKAAQIFGLSVNKIISPKLAQMLDSNIAKSINNGENPSNFINFVSKAVHFASGADAEDVSTLMKYGVNKSLSDPEVNSKNAIVNIAQNIVKSTQQRRAELGQEVGNAGMELAQKAGNAALITKPALSYLQQEIQNKAWGDVTSDGLILLKRNPYNPTDTNKLGSLLKQLGAEPVVSKTQNILTSPILRPATSTAERLGYNINNPSDQGLIEEMMNIKKGSIQSELNRFEESKVSPGTIAFKIPENPKISLKDGINIKNTAGSLTDADKSPLSDDMRRVFSNTIYGDESNGSFQNGISSQISKLASANGVDNYVASNMAYRNFMKSVENVQNNGFDPFNPKSIQDYGKHINDRQPIDAITLSNFESNIGKPVLDNLKRYSAIQKLSNYNPNFLRLGLISGAIGSMMGNGDFESRLGRGATFALGVPLMLKNTLRATETAGNMGRSIIGKLVKTSPHIISQKLANSVQKSI